MIFFKREFLREERVKSEMKTMALGAIVLGVVVSLDT